MARAGAEFPRCTGMYVHMQALVRIYADLLKSQPEVKLKLNTRVEPALHRSCIFFSGQMKYLQLVAKEKHESAKEHEHVFIIENLLYT